MGKPILVLDFDGVLHSYTSGWKGASVIPDGPVPGMVEFLEKALKEFEVHIFSSRSNQSGGMHAMDAWMRKHILRHFDCEYHAGAPCDNDRAYAIIDALEWPLEKPAAMVTLDDRAITFTGKWPSIDSLKSFKPWNKR